MGRGDRFLGSGWWDTGTGSLSRTYFLRKVQYGTRNLSPCPIPSSNLFLLQNMIFCAILVAEGLLMEIGVIVALVVFLIMVSIAVIAGVIAAISAVSGFEKPDDRDE